MQWIAKHGLRGGVLLPHVPPDCTHIKPLYAPDYDRFWAVCQDLGVVLNHHGGTGSPDYGPYKVALPIRLVETGWFSIRSYTHLLLAGVFERFPKLRYIVTESGCAWVPATLANLDALWARMRTGMVGEFQFAEGALPPEKPSFYAEAQLLLRRELAVAARARRPPRDRRRPPVLGQRLPALRGHLSAHPEVAAPHLQRHGPQRGARDARRERREASTTSISRCCSRSPTSSARHRTRSAPARARGVPEGRAHDGVQLLNGLQESLLEPIWATFRLTSRAMKIVGKSWPSIASLIATKRASGVAGTMSP